MISNHYRNCPYGHQGYSCCCYNIGIEREKDLKQQLSKAQADLRLAVEALEKIKNTGDLDIDNYSFDYNITYSDFLRNLSNEAIKQIKEKKDE